MRSRVGQKGSKRHVQNKQMDRTGFESHPEWRHMMIGTEAEQPRQEDPRQTEGDQAGHQPHHEGSHGASAARHPRAGRHGHRRGRLLRRSGHEKGSGEARFR